MQSLFLILSRKRYFAPAWVFASLNIMIGTWVLFIPRIKENLAINDGQLGVALFCSGLGALPALLFSSKVIKNVGTGKATLVGIIIFALLFVLPVWVPSYLALCVCLFMVGMASCFTDIAMNALVSDIEVEDGIHIMSASHGFFSIGGAIAAIAAYFLMDYVNIPAVYMMGAVIIVISLNVLLAKNYWNHRSAKIEEQGKLKLSLLIPLLGLTVVALLIMGSEGAIEQWSKLYLKDVILVTTERLAGLGFLCFSVGMAVGRFLGDGVSKKLGPMKTIMAGCLLGIFGYVGVLTGDALIVIGGFWVIGLGFSVIIPELLRVAGKTKGVHSADGISFVAGAGFIGFLASPPLMGFLADYSSLRLSFLVMGLGCVIALIVALVLSRRA